MSSIYNKQKQNSLSNQIQQRENFKSRLSLALPPAPWGKIPRLAWCTELAPGEPLLILVLYLWCPHLGWNKTNSFSEISDRVTTLVTLVPKFSDICETRIDFNRDVARQHNVIWWRQDGLDNSGRARVSSSRIGRSSDFYRTRFLSTA